MKRENSEVSAMLATMRELSKQKVLNSTDRLLGRILARTVMSLSEPDMLTEDELEMFDDFMQQIGMSPDDIVRMASSIMAENIVKKMRDLGHGDGLMIENI